MSNPLGDVWKVFEAYRSKAEKEFDDAGMTAEEVREYRRKLAERSGSHLELMIPRADDARLQSAGEVLNILAEMSMNRLLVMGFDPEQQATVAQLMALSYNLHRAATALHRDLVQSEFRSLTNSQAAAGRQGTSSSPIRLLFAELINSGCSNQQIRDRLNTGCQIGDIHVEPLRGANGDIEAYEFTDFSSDKEAKRLKVGSLSQTISEVRKALDS